MIIKINQAKTLLKQVSCDFKSQFDSATCNSNQKSKIDKCRV